MVTVPLTLLYLLDNISADAKPARVSTNALAFFLHLIMSEVHFVNCTPLAEETLAKIARVSNPQNENNNKTAPQLIRYMWDHAHYSPFEMADMTLEILTTRAISPQILRHGKGFSFQEFSQRYSNINKIGRIETPQLRAQDPKNRQNSTNDLAQKIGKPALADLQRKVAIHLEEAGHLYQELVSNGVALESARYILPLAAPTRLYMKGPLRSWIFYIALRTDPSTQIEHRVLAEAAKDIFIEQFPILSEAMGWFSTELLVKEIMSTDGVTVSPNP